MHEPLGRAVGNSREVIESLGGGDDQKSGENLHALIHFPGCQTHGSQIKLRLPQAQKPHSVMVTPQILILLFKVRALVRLLFEGGNQNSSPAKCLDLPAQTGDHTFRFRDE